MSLTQKDESRSLSLDHYVKEESEVFILFKKGMWNTSYNDCFYFQTNRRLLSYQIVEYYWRGAFTFAS